MTALPTRHDAFNLATAAPQSGSVLVRSLLQLATLAFWLPCATIDAYYLWMGRGDVRTYGYVFKDLFREAIVFLALWLVIGAVQGLLFSRSTTSDSGRGRSRRGRSSAIGASDFGRDRRGA